MAESTVSTSQHTENYDLPIWDKDDLTSWQGNLNDAFTKIDKAINENRVAMTTFQEQLDALGESGEQTDTSVNGVKEAVAKLEETIASVNSNLETLETSVDNLKQDYASQITNIAGQFNTLNATIEDLEDDIGNVENNLADAVVDITKVSNRLTKYAHSASGTVEILATSLTASSDNGRASIIGIDVEGGSCYITMNIHVKINPGVRVIYFQYDEDYGLSKKLNELFPGRSFAIAISSVYSINDSNIYAALSLTPGNQNFTMRIIGDTTTEVQWDAYAIRVLCQARKEQTS